MCKVLLRFAPGTTRPLILAAIRDEFADRPWDPPAEHWPSAPGLVGGRDRVAGGTWLAVSPATLSVAAVLNGAPLPPPGPGLRRSRGWLALSALVGGFGESTVEPYDRFHLVVGRPDAVTVWSWDGTATRREDLAPGDHILVNQGVDAVDDPVVAHFAPLLAATPTDAEHWRHLLAGDGLAPDDERSVLVRKEFEGRAFESRSAALVTISDVVSFDFTATPMAPCWRPVPVRSSAGGELSGRTESVVRRPVPDRGLRGPAPPRRMRRTPRP
jgi:Transport and Golgi organisation 2